MSPPTGSGGKPSEKDARIGSARNRHVVLPGDAKWRLGVTGCGVLDAADSRGVKGRPALLSARVRAAVRDRAA